MEQAETIATIKTVVAGVVLALILSVLVIFAMRRLRSRPLPSLRGVLRWVGWVGRVLIAVVLLIILVAVLGPFGPIWWAVAGFVFVEALRKHRAARQYGLLWLLSVSAERSMPLVPAVEAFARERGGSFSRRAKQLAEMLGQGVPLPDALDRCPGLLPPHALPMVRLGCESGTLASALRQAATASDFNDPVWVALNGRIAYLLLLPAYALVIVAFIVIKILPAYVKIFQDFDTALPPLTQRLISVANCVFICPCVFIPLYLVGLALLFYTPLRYFCWIRWDLPGLGRLTRRFDSARILDALALVALGQRPLPEGLAALARSYPKSDIRRRLGQATADVESGLDWCESLRRHGLIRQPELAVLRAAQRVGNLPWALTEMADSVRRRLAYRVQAAAQMLFPPIVVLMGLMVMFVVVALFLPLIYLIQSLV